MKYDCPICDKPQAVSIWSLLDHRYHIGYCEHPDPFAARGRSTSHASDSTVLGAVAALEAQERNIRDGLDPYYEAWWDVRRCAICQKPAAGARDIDLIGWVVCRACHKAAPSLEQRADAIAAAQHAGQQLEKFHCTGEDCESLTLVEKDWVPWEDQDPALSWCLKHHTRAKRQALAEAYAESRTLSEPVATWLFRDVADVDPDANGRRGEALLRLASARQRRFKRVAHRPIVSAPLAPIEGADLAVD